jgi:hypothetical protein
MAWKMTSHGRCCRWKLTDRCALSWFSVSITNSLVHQPTRYLHWPDGSDAGRSALDCDHPLQHGEFLSPGPRAQVAFAKISAEEKNRYSKTVVGGKLVRKKIVEIHGNISSQPQALPSGLANRAYCT